MATKKATTKMKASAKKAASTRAGTRDKRRDAPVQEPAEGTKVAREIASLAKLGKTELWKRHKEVFGHETRSCNTKHLRNVIARRLVELAGGKKAKAPKSEESAANGTAATSGSTGVRDPRLPKVGTVLKREHKGKVHEVKVLEDGFEYRGQSYRSLSGLAKEITGAIWNGWVWFGLVTRPALKKETADAG
jgi:hypothetical protein